MQHHWYSLMSPEINKITDSRPIEKRIYKLQMSKLNEKVWEIVSDGQQLTSKLLTNSLTMILHTSFYPFLLFISYT